MKEKFELVSKKVLDGQQRKVSFAEEGDQDQDQASTALARDFDLAYSGEIAVEALRLKMNSEKNRESTVPVNYKEALMIYEKNSENK